MLRARWHCEVITAHSLAEVKVITAEKPDHFFLAISDIHLPDTSDAEVIHYLIELGIPTIAVTANFNNKFIEMVRRLGVIDYVIKNSINAYAYVVDLVGRIHSNASKTVLIAGESAALNEKVGQRLSRQLLNVEYETESKAVLQHIESDPSIKMVILNYNHPDYDSAEILASIRQHFDRKYICVIVTSKSMDPSKAEINLKLGANDFITIPFSDAEFASRINRSLDMQDAYASVAYLAFHDELSGLLNRRAFFDAASQHHSRAISDAKPLNLMMLDVDHFKRINDQYGHYYGDLVIKHLAQRLVQLFPEELIARIGGEEFVVLASNYATLVNQAERLRQEVEQDSIETDKGVIRYTISIGITQTLTDSIDTTLKLADANLYRAKESGRNCLIVDS
jgi:diguanylate cyclase (GGDEF)-like protein